MNSPHEVNKLTIDIHGSISSDIGRFMQETVHKVLLKYFDTHFPSDQILVIDKIHFDLGTLRGKFIKEEFEVRLAYLLHTELQKFLQSKELAKQIGENIAFTLWENFIHYLQTGFSRGDDRELAALFEQLLTEHVHDVKEIFIIASKSETAYKRLLFQVKFESLERYWLRVYPDHYHKIRKINDAVMDEMTTRFSLGKQNTVVLELLRKNTFFFMNMITSVAKVEKDYVTYLQRHAEDFEAKLSIHVSSYFDEFFQALSNDERRIAKSADEDLLEALIFYMETGRLTGILSHGQPAARTPSLPRESLLKLVRYVSFTSGRLTMQIKRLLAVLTVTEWDVVLAEMQRTAPSKFATRINRLFYIRFMVRAVWAEDIMHIGRALIGDYLVSSTADTVDQVYLLDEFIKLVAAKRGLAKIDLIKQLKERLQSSFHQEATSLKKQLAVIETVDDTFESPNTNSGDQVGIYMHYLRTGIWGLIRISPQELLRELWSSSQEKLLAHLKKHLDLHVVWLRLIYQNPIDILIAIVSSVFKDDPHLTMLIGKLNDEMTATNDVSVQRTLLESFVMTKSQLGTDDQNQFLFLFEQRVMEQLDNLRAKEDRSDVVTGPRVEPEQEENGEWYMISFIHFFKFKRHLYHRVEQDGWMVALNKITTHWLQPFLELLRKEPDSKQILLGIFDQLPEGESDWLFKRLAPDFQNQLDEVVDVLSSQHKMDRSEVLASWINISMFSNHTLSVPKIISLLRKEHGLGIVADQSTDDSLPIQENVNLVQAWDIVTQLIQTGKFISGSAIESGAELLELLTLFAKTNVTRLNHLFHDLLMHRTNAENLLAMLRYDRFIHILNELEPTTVMLLERLVNIQVTVHERLGSKEALKTYFYRQYILAYYTLNSNSASRLTASVLQEVAADFGWSSSDYITFLKEHPHQVFDDYSTMLSYSNERAIPVDDQHKMDMLLHGILYGEIPWWGVGRTMAHRASLEQQIDHWALTLWSKEPNRWLKTIQASGKSSTIYNRIAPLLSSLQFDQIIRTISPKAADVIRHIRDVLYSKKYIVNQNAWRSFLLTYITEHEIEDEQAFMKSAMSYLSLSLRISPEKLLVELATWLEPPSEKIKLPVTTTDTSSVILHYVRTGSLPQGKLSSIRSHSELIDYMQRYLDSSSEVPRHSIVAALGDVRIRSRIITNESLAFVDFLIGILDLGEKQKLLELRTTVVNLFHDRWPSVSITSWRQLVHQVVFEVLLETDEPKLSIEKWMTLFIQRAKTEFGFTTLPDANELRQYGFSEVAVYEFVNDERIDKNKSASEKEEFLMALKQYLITGQSKTGLISNLPAWEERLKQETAHVNHELRSLLIKLFSDPTIRTRVVRNESESLLILLIRLLYPNQNNKLEIHQRSIEKLWSKQFPTIDAKSWREHFYLILLEQRDVTVSAEKVMVHVVNRAKDELGIVLPLQTSWLQHAGFDQVLIDELIHSKLAIHEQHELVDAVAHYLRSGSIPDHLQRDLPNPSAIASWLKRAVANNTQELRKIMFNTLSDPVVQRRMVRQESESLLAAVMDILYPTKSRSLEIYRKNLIEFTRDSISPATLHEHFYPFLWTGKNSQASAEQLIISFMLSVKSSFNLEFEADKLQVYGFPLAMVQDLLLQDDKPESQEARSEIEHREEKSSEIFSAAVRYYLRTGLMPEHLLPSIKNKLELEQQLSQQLDKGNSELKKSILMFIAEERVRLRMIRKENESMRSIIMGMVYPKQLRALEETRDAVIQFMLDEHPFISSARLQELFYLRLFESAVESDQADQKIIPVMMSWITKSVQVFNLSLQANEVALKRYGLSPELIGELVKSRLITLSRYPESSKSESVNDQSVLDQFDSGVRYYLRTGLLAADLLPGITSHSQLEYELQQRVASGNPRIRSSIIDSLRDHQVRSRLIRSETKSFLFTLLEVILPGEIEKLKQYQPLVTQFILDHSGASSYRLLNEFFFQTVLPEIGENQAVNIHAEHWMALFISRATERFNAKWPSTHQALKQYGFSQQLIDGLIQSGIQIISSETETTIAIRDADAPRLGTDRMVTSDVHLLFHLILEREMPWWAKEQITISEVPIDRAIEKLVNHLLSHHPHDLFTEVRQHEKSDQLYVRILITITNQQFNNVVSKLNASSAKFMVGFSRLVLTWRNNLHVVAWRSFVIDDILDHPTRHAQSFIRDAIIYLAKSEQVTLDHVRTALLNIVNQFIQRGESSYRIFIDPLVDVDNRVVSFDEGVQSVRLAPLSIQVVLSYYLKTGSLPAGVLPALKSYSAFVKYIQRQLDLGVEELIPVIEQSLGDERVRLRIIRNETESFLFMLVGALYPRQKQKLKTYLGMVTSFFRAQQSDLPRSAFDELFYQTLFEAVLEKDYTTRSAEQLIIRFMLKAKQVFGSPKVFEMDVLQRYGFNIDLIGQLLKLSGDDNREEEWFSAQDIPELKLDQRVLVKNAGLVIAWPYLSRYFDLLSMTEDSKFKTEEDATRAVHLLQYIATGFASAPEHELLLNKVLCGVKIATPVPIEITLSDKEKEVSAMMLNGLLQNWDRLKGSSIEALQEGFLMREGYLMETDEVWQLKVEKKTLDILMENLPWSFGTIKLPWMEKRMIVEWL